MVDARSQHPNAPLTPNGRRRMVDCVFEGGWTIEQRLTGSKPTRRPFGSGATGSFPKVSQGCWIGRRGRGVHGTGHHGGFVVRSCGSARSTVCSGADPRNGPTPPPPGGAPR